jgi:hypothetical protein
MSFSRIYSYDRPSKYYILDGFVIAADELTKEEAFRLAHGEGDGPFNTYGEAAAVAPLPETQETESNAIPI